MPAASNGVMASAFWALVFNSHEVLTWTPDRLKFSALNLTRLFLRAAALF
jgi:hypothetical protein